MNTIVVYVIPFFQIVFSKGKEQHKRDLLSVFHLCFPFPCMHGTWSEILTTLVQAHKSIKNVNGIFGFMPCSIVKGVIIRDIVHNIALPQDSHQVLITSNFIVLFKIYLQKILKKIHITNYSQSTIAIEKESRHK